MFDDLIPGNPTPAGMFDDLIPPAKRKPGEWWADDPVVEPARQERPVKGRPSAASAGQGWTGWEVDSEVPAWEIESEEPAGGPLPKRVQPSQAGAGRGTSPGKSAAQEAELQAATGARRGTMRATRPYVANEPVLQPKSVLERQRNEPLPDTRTPEEQDDWRRAMLKDEVAPWKREQIAKQGEYVTGSKAGVLTAAPTPSVIDNMVAATRARPLDNSLPAALLQRSGDALAIVEDLRLSTVGGLFQTMELGADALRLVTATGNDGALADLSDWARKSGELVRTAKSPELRQDAAELSRIIQDEGANVATVLGFLLSHPRLLAAQAAESAPTMLVGAGTGKAGAALVERLSLAALKAAPATPAVLDRIAELSASGARAGAIAGETALGAGGVYANVLREGGSSAQAATAAGLAALGYALIGRATGGGAEGALASGQRRGALPTAGLEALQEGGQSLSESAGQAWGTGKDLDIAQALKQASNDALVGGLSGGGVALLQSAVARQAPRVEEMPTTPFSPEQTAAMAASAQARREARVPAEQQANDAEQAGRADQVPQNRPDVAAATSAVANETRTDGAGADRTRRFAEQDARGTLDRAGVAQPGQVPRGSLVDEARRRLATQAPPTDPEANAAPNVAAAPATGRIDESSGSRQPAVRQAANTVVPAEGRPDGASSKQPLTEQAASGNGARVPEQFPATADTFASRDAALVAAVQRGQWQRLEPAQESDGTWTLTQRQQTAEQRGTDAPPSAAQPDARSATNNAGALSTGSTATGQATPQQEARPSADRQPRQARPEAPTREVDLQRTAATATSGAAHADPGRQAEPVNAPVVAKSVTTAVDNTQRRPAELRADLMQQIDTALADAPDEDLPTWKRPTKERLRQAMVDMKLTSLERAEQALKQAHDNRVAEASQRIGFVNFDVPGDGRFKVLRTASRLAEFKRLVEKSAGFKSQRQATAPEPDGVQRGSPSVKAAVENMLAEGDAQAAADYLAAKGLDAVELGLPASALAKLVGVTPTAQVDAEPAAQEGAQQFAEGRLASEASGAMAAGTEALAPSAAAEALAVRPAEMTQDEFIKSTVFARDGNAANPWTARWQGVQLESDATGFDHPDLGKTVAAGARFFPTRKAAVAAARAAHQRAVRRAIRQGEAVPEMVLAGYPNLVKASSAVAEPDTDGVIESDGLGVERERLRGANVMLTVLVAETGKPATVEIDAAVALDDADQVERKALAGRLTAGDSPTFAARLAAYVADGVEASEARRMAGADAVDEAREWRTEVATAVRQQHPELFVGVDSRGEGRADPERIEDFGQVIPGARKDAARAWADKLALAETLTVSEETLSKSWPEPDYQQLLDGGVDPYLVAFAHAARDAVSQKPVAAWKLRGWAGNVTALRDMAKTALVGQATPELVRDALAALPSAHRDIAGLADLYRELGHGVSLKGITLQRHSFSFRDGKRHDPPLMMWTVEKPAKATAMSNWPNELATGATKEEAIAAFKPRHQLMLAGAESAAPKAPTRFDIVAYRGTPGVTIGKKVGREFIGLKQFDTAAQARQFRQDNQAELERLLAEAKQVPPERRAENLPRIGVDHRDAGDVTPAQFTEAFGFKGVQFGNYVESARRQRDLNDAFDALMDLAGVLGLPPRSLSLGGTIGLAFGARGNGGKNAPSAHFEPALGAINLTKGGGAGSLAHEWFHAADNAFSRQRNEPLGFLTQRPYARGAGVRPEMIAAFKRLMDTITATGMAARSKELDKTRSKPYWSTDLELAARAFESYVVAKLEDQGAANDYLANIVSPGAYGKPAAYPYPTLDEAPAIRAAFDSFFAAVQTRQDDAGNVALFQRRRPGAQQADDQAGDQAERNALQALSENDDLFVLPRATGMTVEAIAAEIAPAFKVRKTVVSNLETMYRLTVPDGSFALVVERKPNPYGPQSYDFETVGGDEVPITDRPGDNPDDVDPSTVDVFIDASRLKSGGGGAQVYAIAAGYAHNTGKLFIGDPAGLSDEALRRRPEQMLASALKYGTTRHLAPHPRQGRGDASLGMPPLRWVYGDDLGNIRRLVDLNLAALENQGYDDTSLRFDLPTGRYFDAAGQEVGRDGFGARVAAGAGRGAIAGSKTLARGAVLRALVREEGAALEGPNGRRDGLLARLAGIADDPSTADLFYSRAGSPAGGDASPVADPQRLRLVRAAVDETTAGWAAAPQIAVLASMQDAPEPVRAANIRQLSQGAQGEPAAFYFDGKVYLLASQMASRRDVAEAVAHEALGHFGLRRTFGSELEAVLQELAALREADVRAKADEYGLDFADKDQRLQAAEEVLAELAQTQPELGLVKRAIAAIRTWLRKNLAMLADMPLSDAEIIRSFILPARAYVVDGAVAQRSGQAGDSATFARQRRAGSDDEASPMAGFRSWLDSTGADGGARVRFTGQAGDAGGTTAAQLSERGRLPAFIDVDGQQRPTSDSSGQPLGVDDEAVRDFWRRFVGSAVVDAQGRPQLVHGSTAARGGFSQVQAGPLSAGIYLRSSAEAALTDGASALAARGSSRTPTTGAGYLVLRNPYVFNAASFEWPAGFTVGGALATMERPAGPPADPPGSPLAALLDRVLPAAQSRPNLLAMARSGGDIGPALRDQLQAMGHDGLVVRFADPAYGEPAYVAFDRGQAIHAWRSATDAPAASSVREVAPSQSGGARQSLPESIEVDGRQRPTRDASGRLIAANADAIGNFWRWFGDSRAVDSAGRPIPLFHGTGKDIDAFMASRSGMLGSGVYITGNAASANEYATTFNEGGAGRVMSVYARLRNPYFFAMRESWLPGWYDPPINNAFKDAEDLPWGIKLVADVMPRDSARRIIDRLLREGSINVGAAVTDQLKAMGHDGIVAFDGQADPARQPDDTIWTDPKNEVVVFDPKAIKSATGNTGAFAEGTRSTRFQRRQTAAEEQPAQDIALRPFGRAGRIVEVLQDRFNRWKQAIDDVRRQGGTVNDDNDFYRAEERYWGQVGAGIEEFKDQLKAFVKAVASDGLRIEDVALYAYAQHAPERNAWVASRRPDMPDGGSGMTSEEADEILEAARQAGVEAELQRHALTLRRWIQGTRDVLFYGGLLDQEEYDTWIGMFQSYVPLRGTDDDAVAVAGQPAGVRRAKPRGGISGDEAERANGRTTQALQIIEQIAHDRAKALIRSGRNNVLRSFARFVLDNPEPSLWEINAVERRRSTVVDEDGYSRAQDTEQVISDGRTITLKDAGQEIHILVKDAKLLEQLQRMGVDERTGWAIGALLSANRYLSRIYTSLSPVFTAINALRDAQAAAIGMIDEIGFLGAPKLFAKLPGAWLESFKAEAGKPSADYQLFAATGGRTSFHNLVTIDQQAQELADIVKDAERSIIDPRKALPKAMALIESLNGGIENATRLAAFKVARESGKTTLEAASIAKNITVNFNRKGTQQLGNAWVLFFNPAVQGTARVAKAMASPKVVTTMGVAMLGVAALALRNAGMGDDDDGVAWWDKIPDEVKERNIVIVLPPGAKAGEAVPKSKTGRYIKIPMPYGYNFFAVVANQVVDVWRHEQDKRRGRDALKAGMRAFSAFASSWLPAQDLGRAFTEDDSTSAGKSAVLLAIPDALDPLARIGLNQDSFGRPMRPDSRFSENLPDSTNYFAGQHGTMFQRGAAAMNQATGGTRYQAGMVDVAPSTLEHLARSYGGGPVSFGLDIINALYVRQSIARPELDAKRLPFAKQFYGVIDAETDRLTGYQRLEATEKLVDPINRAIAAGDGEQAREMRKAAGPVAGLGDAVQQARRDLGVIVKAERKTIDSVALTDDAKYVKLLELAEKRRRLLQKFNTAYDRAVLATAQQQE